MTTVHIVDDIEGDRHCVATLLEKSWGTSSGAPRPAQVNKDWRFIWDLTESGELEPGDVVIADLYPAGYWREVPQPTLYAPEPSLPDDPTNLYKAALDVIQRFMRQVPERSAHLIVVTYVPNFIEKDLHIPVLAEKIRGVLAAESFEFFEKNDQFQDEAAFAQVVDRTNAVLRGEE